jgi:hypothetical protein
MSLIGETQFLERLQYFNGQRLFASDLDAAESFHREMRWLHNQSLHQPGVGAGYAVSGGKGEREVSVQPGYALDAEGREIVLTQARTLTVPPVSGEENGKPAYYDLVVSYPNERDLEESETREGICLPRGVVRLKEEPVFCWVRLTPCPDLQPVDPVLKQDLEQALRIRLARAEVLDCRLNRALSTAQRLDARPHNIPYVACGTSGGAAWQADTEQPGVLRLFQEVDTSVAGFRARPSYQAHAAGERLVAIGETTILLEGFTHVTDIRADGFTLHYLVPLALVRAFLGDTTGGEVSEEALKILLEVIQESWTVEWIGVEA